MQRAHLERANVDVAKRSLGKRPPKLGEQAGFETTGVREGRPRTRARAVVPRMQALLAEAESSHCTSSTATRSGPSAASARNALSTATPTACGSGGGPSSSSSTSARARARRCGSGSGARASSRTGSRRSPSPEKENVVSLSAGRALSTRTLLFRLRDALGPERRLPHAGLALKHESRRAVGDARDEISDGRQLGVPANDDPRHSSNRTPVRTLSNSRR